MKVEPGLVYNCTIFPCSLYIGIKCRLSNQCQFPSGDLGGTLELDKLGKGRSSKVMIALKSKVHVCVFQFVYISAFFCLCFVKSKSKTLNLTVQIA